MSDMFQQARKMCIDECGHKLAPKSLTIQTTHWSDVWWIGESWCSTRLPLQYSRRKVGELKQALETAGLPVTGKKARHGGELLVTETAGMILSISSFKAFRNFVSQSFKSIACADTRAHVFTGYISKRWLSIMSKGVMLDMLDTLDTPSPKICERRRDPHDGSTSSPSHIGYKFRVVFVENSLGVRSRT